MDVLNSTFPRVRWRGHGLYLLSYQTEIRTTGYLVREPGPVELPNVVGSVTILAEALNAREISRVKKALDLVAGRFPDLIPAFPQAFWDYFIVLCRAHTYKPLSFIEEATRYDPLSH